MKPLIGLTMHPVEGKMEINNTYINVIKRAGGIPLCIPYLDEETVDSVIDSLNGVLLIGGYDVNPLIYGQEPHPKLGMVIDESTVPMFVTEDDRLMVVSCLALAGLPLASCN